MQPKQRPLWFILGACTALAALVVGVPLAARATPPAVASPTATPFPTPPPPPPISATRTAPPGSTFIPTPSLTNRPPLPTPRPRPTDGPPEPTPTPDVCLTPVPAGDRWVTHTTAGGAISFDHPANWTAIGEYKNNLGLLNVGGACRERFPTEVPEHLHYFKVTENENARRDYATLESYLATASPPPSGVTRTQEPFALGGTPAIRTTTNVAAGVPEWRPGRRLSIVFLAGDSIFVLSGGYSAGAEQQAFDRLIASLRVHP